MLNSTGPITTRPASNPPIEKSPATVFAGRTVRLYSTHDTADQGKWVADTIANYLEHVPSTIPALVVMEHPFPGLPNLAELRSVLNSRIQALASQDPRRAELSKWPGELLLDPPPKVLTSFLREIRNEIVGKNHSVRRISLTDDLFAENGGHSLMKLPFSRAILNGLRTLSQSGRPIFEINERSRFDAWVYNVQAKAHDEQSFAHLAIANVAEAIAAKCRHARSSMKCNLIRDDENAALVDGAHKKWPGMIVFTVFGSNHVETQTSGFAKLGRDSEVIQLNQPRLDARTGCDLTDPDSALRPAARHHVTCSVVADSLASSKIPEGWAIDKKIHAHIFPLLAGVSRAELSSWGGIYSEAVGNRRDLPRQATIRWLNALSNAEVKERILACLPV